MRVGLVVIGRLENRYAVEFVDHYKKIGFDNIIIIDNNQKGEEHFEEVLQQYIDDKFVIIDKSYRNKSVDTWQFRGNALFQAEVYLYIYYKFSKYYDWLAFFDFDEFLILEKDNNIKKYLSRPNFRKYFQILINWKIYTDNDLVYDDGRGCLERFTAPMDINRCIEYQFPENFHIKSIIRTRIPYVKIFTSHNFYGNTLNLHTCDSVGNQFISGKWTFNTFNINYNLAYLKHFTTKTIDEWVNNKLVRRTPDRTKEDFEKSYPLKRFFKYNNITKEKLNYLEEHGYDINDIIDEKIKKEF